MVGKYLFCALFISIISVQTVSQELTDVQRLAVVFSDYRNAPLHEKPSFFSQSFIAFRLRSIIRQESEENILSSAETARKAVNILQNYDIKAEGFSYSPASIKVELSAISKINGKSKTIVFHYIVGVNNQLLINSLKVTIDK